MTINAKLKVSYANQPVPAGTPIKEVKLANSKGYFDLILNLNANGKAIRISDRNGESRVHITVGEVDALIEALKLVKKDGKKTKVEDLSYSA